jgi:MFS family permease
VSRFRLPDFIAEIVDDRPAFRALIGASLALLAAGIEPRVASPAVADVQEAIRANPEIASLAMFVGVLAAGMLLLGGVAGDAYRTRRIVRGALVALVVSAAVSLVVPSGLLFMLSRVVGAAAAGLTIPFAIATAATVYSGRARATSIGLAYAGYGAGTALPPILLTITGPGGNDWPAYLAAAAAALVALRVSRAIPDLPGARSGRLLVVAQLALWAFGLIAVTAGVTLVGAGLQFLRIATIGLGVAALVAAAVISRAGSKRHGDLPIKRRAVGVVLIAGIVLGLAQAIPQLLLPTFFQLILGYGPLFATLATAPFIVALLVAGPVAGILLPRFSARVLIGGGLIVVGLGDLALAWFVQIGASYLVFVMPFVLVAAGFVIGTTVRTAVIFASVPSDLPASAAALNEASVGLGAQIGISMGIVVLSEVTLRVFAQTLPTGVNVDAALAPLRSLLVAIGTPDFTDLAGTMGTDVLRQYAGAYVEAIRVVHLAAGVLAVLGGLFVTFALGHFERLTAVWRED